MNRFFLKNDTVWKFDIVTKFESRTGYVPSQKPRELHGNERNPPFWRNDPIQPLAD